MPHPRKNEKKEHFISRCISHLVKKEDRSQKQAIAMCHSFWRNRGKKKKKRLRKRK